MSLIRVFLQRLELEPITTFKQINKFVLHDLTLLQISLIGGKISLQNRITVFLSIVDKVFVKTVWHLDRIKPPQHTVGY